MPILDKPLAELRHYTGRNPRPDDFDAYWTAALGELDATPPDPELVPNTTLSTRSAECLDLWFTGVGGARIHAKYVRPKGASACPALVSAVQTAATGAPVCRS